jgi:very-short-patch-repair endonuclease
MVAMWTPEKRARDARLRDLGYNVVRVPGDAIKRNPLAALEAAWRL